MADGFRVTGAADAAASVFERSAATVPAGLDEGAAANPS